MKSGGLGIPSNFSLRARGQPPLPETAGRGNYTLASLNNKISGAGLVFKVENSKRLFRLSIISLILSISHIYCIGVGNYKWFPFELIQGIKQSIIGSQSANANINPSPWMIEKGEVYENLVPYEDCIVMLGDSLTDNCEWHELFLGKKIINRGLSSDTTLYLKTRIKRHLVVRPSKIFLLIGINDLNNNRDIDDIERDYIEIINTLKDIVSANAIFCQSVLPVSEDKCSSTRIVELNKRIRELSNNNGVVFVDLYHHFLKNGSIDKELFIDDGIHLSISGYRKWAQIIEPLF